jgi:hypothetical protein
LGPSWSNHGRTVLFDVLVSLQSLFPSLDCLLL